MAAPRKRRRTKKKQPLFTLSPSQKIFAGSFLIFLGLALLIAMLSFCFSWQTDQSEIGQFTRHTQTKNVLRIFGAHIGYWSVYKGFGIASTIPAFLLTVTGFFYFFNRSRHALYKYWLWGLFLMVWLAVFLAFFPSLSGIAFGVVGLETHAFLSTYLGKVGVALLLGFLIIMYSIFRLKWKPENTLNTLLKKQENTIASETKATASGFKTTKVDTLENSTAQNEVTVEKPSAQVQIDDVSYPLNVDTKADTDIPMEVATFEEEDLVKSKAKDLVQKFGTFDPTLELSQFKFPPINLLHDHAQSAGVTINQEELEENKVRIIETLSNYRIGISQINAAVGPTVTLYEIIPEAGIRISKIKSLEDDIALSLSALGIRIIAPIPGKGTIGIEVPNKNPKTVSMRAVIASPKFQNAEMQLPLALGKTISNETFVVDLAKMPHLLMAGATGQGKSVGLNAILTSLLYKKHPAEIKFVLVDPKKVELSLFNKIERHYLAKLPDTEEAIITDTSQVINTLNSLCLEMDTRYELLKNGYVRNIKEYNNKFKNRKLNPEDGHHFLPYIVLVIDEFADLIMTAGKEIEMPIARLAQLARAVGIHLIIATQRPSVNVITGIIKANFPARVAFRVTSKIDSRTILDNSGADQLIGRGDMLFTQGNDLIRLQCAFVDTPEIAAITDYIGSQKAFPEAHILPEFQAAESGTSFVNEPSERDSKFLEAARVVVETQQGSTSLIQRKLKLGYNRAGRIIDQLEAAGIVGPFEGSKARQVLVPTLEALHQHLNNEN